VTGVQTCALPIYLHGHATRFLELPLQLGLEGGRGHGPAFDDVLRCQAPAAVEDPQRALDAPQDGLELLDVHLRDGEKHDEEDEDERHHVSIGGHPVGGARRPAAVWPATPTTHRWSPPRARPGSGWPAPGPVPRATGRRGASPPQSAGSRPPEWREPPR